MTLNQTRDESVVGLSHHSILLNPFEAFHAQHFFREYTHNSSLFMMKKKLESIAWTKHTFFSSVLCCYIKLRSIDKNNFFYNVIFTYITIKMNYAVSEKNWIKLSKKYS